VRKSTIVMVAFAVVFGLLAVFVAQSWLDSAAESRMRSLKAQNKPIATRTIVVAAKPLRFGNELTAQHLREIPWPDTDLPNGSFAKVADLLTGKRVVLTPIEVNEPVLGTKVTGPGQRATVSSMLRDGLKAFTVRVNDVDGVAGFVLPGDRVDVALTRQVDKTLATTDIVLQNARVLAVDQVADERTDKPSVAKAVTLEVDVVGAQKLSLSATIGTLSLVLRKAGDSNAEYTRRVSLRDLENATTPVAKERKNADTTTVTVTRASVRQEYNVPVETVSDLQAAAVSAVSKDRGYMGKGGATR
jgi:pilus assembly protein CpaB